MLVASALALAIERVAYAVIWHRPDLFTRFCRGVAPSRDPVDVVAALFVGFKGIQAVVFLAWCLVHGGSAARDSGEVAWLVSGVGLLAAGQILNVSVFLRLGRTGVFYGNRLGHDVPWCEGFPFSAIRHPQYVGTVLSIPALLGECLSEGHPVVSARRMRRRRDIEASPAKIRCGRNPEARLAPDP